MASVIEIGGKFRAQVRIKGHRTKTQTFETEAQAWAWGNQVEQDLRATKPVPVVIKGLTVGEMVTAYRSLRDKGRPISDQSTEHYTLKMLTRLLGDRVVVDLKPEDFVGFAAARVDEGAGPYTINMDVSKLGTVLRYAAAAKNIALPDVVGAARPLLSHMRLIGGGGKRERRPTEDEMVRIVAHLASEFGAIYAECVVFAAVSAMRRGEICELKRSDVDPATRCASILRKHPKKGKIMERVPLVGEAWDIYLRQPERDDGRVFPVHPQTLSKYFKAACDALGVPDLHFHDMRHEGTSRLFEDGYEIQQVALVTGHKDWRNLKRYTNLKPESMTTQQPAAPRRNTQQRRGSRPTASRTPGKF